ncbi:MAG: hypothetical protein AB1896_23680, partial [Thermodesulfobacteriota bacterium]
EEALEGGALFGMSFIRARITALNVAVFQMVKHLCLLAPGKYDLLFERLGAIQEEINRRLAEKRSPGTPTATTS